MKKYFTLSMLFTLLCGVIFGQVVTGTIYDAKFDRPVANASIQLVETGQGDYTDESGQFEIENVNPGTYTLRVSLVGYLIDEKEVEVTSAGITGYQVYLQPTNITLNNEFVITARRIETSDFSSPEAITVINSKQLNQESARSTPEALEGATGVYVQKTNHGGGSPYIRGLAGNQNLLMIDGIRLNNATYRYGPNQYLNTVDPQTLSTIDVVRGAGSILYGSDAMGGVVNLITKNPAYSHNGFKVGGNIYGKWMSDDMQKTGRGEINLAGKNIAFTGGISYSDFGDIYGGDTTGKQTPTGYQEFSGDMKLRMRLSSNQELTLAYQYDKQTDVPRYDKLIANYDKYHFDPQIRQLGYARLKSNYQNKWVRQVTITGSYNLSDETRTKQKEGSTKISNEHDLVKTYGATVEVNSMPSKNWNFVSGVEYYYDKVNSEKTDTENGNITEERGYYPDGATSSSIAVYTSHTLDVSKFSFILGGRFNAYQIKAEDSKFEDVDVNPSALVGSSSVIYHLNENHNFIGSVYSAFRAPNLNDLSSFGSFNAGIEVPNPDLAPEKSLNFELGAKAKYEKFSGSVFAFQSRLTDLISRVEATYEENDSIDGEKVYTKKNFAESYIQGVEAEIQYEITTNFTAYGNITYTYGQNETAGEPMRRVPPLNGKLGIYYQHDSGFWGKLEWLSAGKQDRLASGDISDTRIPEGGTPAWNRLDLRAGYSLKWLTLTTGLNNIFDEDYRIHGSGINGYGRSLWLALQVGF